MNKFVSFLEHVGHDFKKGLDPALKVAATAGEVAVQIFAPALGPLFNQTVAAVISAEQNAAAIGQQQGSGTQKLAAVVQLMGGLIKQVLADAGKDNSNMAVERYISAVVTILNAVPVDMSGAAALPATSTPAPAVAAPAAPVSAAKPAGSVNAPIASVLP